MDAYVFHSPQDENNGIRVTVVGEIIGTSMKFAVSRCDGKDPFVRKEGRVKALDRLSKGDLYVTLPLENVSKVQRIMFFINASNAISSAVALFGIERKVELVRAHKVYAQNVLNSEPFERVSEMGEIEFVYIKR